MLFLDSLQSFNAAQRELPFRHQLAGSCGGLPDTSELINEPINAPAMERDTQSSCSGGMDWATAPPLVVARGETPSAGVPRLPGPFGATLTHRQLRGRPFAGQLRSELFLCTDHKTLRITEHITRLLCPSSGPGPRHPPQQVRIQCYTLPPLGAGGLPLDFSHALFA